jgi:hypothetical protein
MVIKKIKLKVDISWTPIDSFRPWSGPIKKVCKAIKFFKSWQTHTLRKKSKHYHVRKITWKPNFFINKNVTFENFKKTATWWYFFWIKGAHLMNTNWLVQMMIMINQKVYKAIKLSKSYRPTPLKNHQKIITEGISRWNPIFFINKNVSCEKVKKTTTWWYICFRLKVGTSWTPIDSYIPRLGLFKRYVRPSTSLRGVDPW